MPFVNRPQPDNKNRIEPYRNANSSQPVIEPARPEMSGLKSNVQQWGTDFAKNQARDYAIGKAAQIAAKTALGARMLFVTRWFFIAEWGSLAVAVVFAVLGIIGLFQKDTILSVLVLILAALAFGLYLVVRMVRRFVERQIARAFAKFQSLLQRGAVRSEDWPNWYQRNKQQV